MNVLWEAMIAEMRAERSDIDSRRHFTAEKDPIVDSRRLIDQLMTLADEDPEVITAHTATSLRIAGSDVEVG